MNYKTYKFNFKDLNLKSSQIEAVLGSSEGDDREFVTGMIEDIMSECTEMCNIKAEYKIFDDVRFDDYNKSFSVGNTDFQIKKIIFPQIKKSDSVAFFLCTAGENIGFRSKKAMGERDFLKGYIYDVVGSEIVEAAADIMQSDLEKSVAASGRKISNRYSPGYCGWDVTEQHKLFELLNENYCGIRLTPSALMDPVKSVSGIIGIGKNVKSNPYTCRMCDLQHCVYRNIKEATQRSL